MLSSFLFDFVKRKWYPVGNGYEGVLPLCTPKGAKGAKGTAVPLETQGFHEGGQAPQVCPCLERAEPP